MNKIEIKCPKCNTENVKYVLFGYPSEEMMMAEERGKFILGGCVPGENNWFCENCKSYFKAKTKFPAGYCFHCKVFLAPEHIQIEPNGKNKQIRICQNCNRTVTP